MAGRVRVPGTNIRVKHHRALAACARYLADGWKMATTDELMDMATFRNGKSIINRLKSKQQLANVLRVHPHFDSIKKKGMYPSGAMKPKAYWFLADRQSYLLGKGQAYPPEYYKQNTGQNVKGKKIKRENA